jgi:hypothetical protein
MQPRFTLILGTLGLAAALAAAPVGVQDNIASLHDKAAFAAPGGGNGHGRGHGRGQGPGNGASLSAHGGSGPGKSGSAPGHGGTGHGQAVGHDAVSGVSSHAAHLNGISPSALGSLSADLGNLNAAHASAQAFENAAANSMVGAIAAAVEASFVNVSDDDEFVDKAEINLGAFETALEGISNKTVNSEVAGAVAGLVDGKVSEQ